MADIGNTANIAKIRLKESSAPSTPASGYGYLYVNASGVLHYIDDAGTDIALGTFAGFTTDTDGTLAANSDTRIATQKATKTYVDTSVTGLLDFKGSTDCSGNPNYPSALKGDSYLVIVAGKIGGASGKSVDVGDFYIAIADNAGGTEASVGSSWKVLEHNLVGALLSANNLSDLASTSTARTNLGLGTAATKDTGYGANNIPVLTGSPGTPDGTKFLRDDGTWVTPAGGGGGGLTQAYIGYNTVGSSWETLTSKRMYLKKVTLAAATQFTSIDVYLRPSTDNVTGIHTVILTDNSGSPDVLVAVGGGTAASDLYLSNSSSMPGAGRWVSFPVGVYLAAGDYWIGFMANGSLLDVAYDGSGSDKYFTASLYIATGAYPSAWTINTSSNKYSIRAGTIS